MSKHKFVVSSEEEKARLIEICKAKSTNDATKLWIETFRQYLKQEDMAELEQISNEELGNIMESFYICVCTNKGEKYKSTTLRAMCAALN